MQIQFVQTFVCHAPVCLIKLGASGDTVFVYRFADAVELIVAACHRYGPSVAYRIN